MAMALGIPAVSAITRFSGATSGAIVVMIMKAVCDRHGHSEDTRQVAVRCLVRVAMDPTTVPM
jgi:hypothetical protein